MTNASWLWGTCRGGRAEWWSVLPSCVHCWPLCRTKPWSLRGIWASVDSLAFPSFRHVYILGHCVARNPGACVASGQVLIQWPSVLPSCVNCWPLRRMKPWSLRGIWASVDSVAFPSFRDVYIVGHCVARNPGACVASGQVLIKWPSVLPSCAHCWPLCRTKPWSLRGIWASVDSVAFPSFRHVNILGHCVARNPEACVASGQVLIQWPSVLPSCVHCWPLRRTKPWSLRGIWASVDSVAFPSFRHVYIVGHCVARNPGACVASGQVLIHWPFRPSVMCTLLAIVSHETLEPAWHLGKC